MKIGIPKMMEAIDIQALPSKDKSYKVWMGKSMFLLVRPDGRKYWRFKYRHEGKENTLSLGVFPEVDLEQAVKARDLARKQIKSGQKPQREKPVPPVGDTGAETQKEFSLAVSPNGGLAISTGISAITLTHSQTKALKAFLRALT